MLCILQRCHRRVRLPGLHPWHLTSRSLALLFLLGALSCVAPVARADDDAPIPSPAPATTSGSHILLSIPDAGGLRITVDAQNKLNIQVAGHQQTVPGVPRTQFKFDPSGNYVIGGSVTLPAHTLTNIFGTGLDLSVADKTVLTATTTGINFTLSTKNSGVSLMLPLKDDTGKKIPAAIEALSINRDGTMSISANIKDPTTVHIPGGFTISAQSVTATYSHKPGGSDEDASITLNTVVVSAPIPGVISQSAAPLKLSVASATVNSDGQVSFAEANLSADAYRAAAENVQVASRKGFAGHRKAAGGGFPFKIPLMKPADFNLIINQASDVKFKMTNNIPDELTLTCDLELPSSFSATAGGTDRVTAKAITLMIGTSGFTAQIPQLPIAYYKGFGIQITDAVLDLSETASGLPKNLPAGTPQPAGGAAWEGIYINKASFVLPDDMILANDDGTTAKAPTIDIANCWIDNNGFTGDIELKGDNGTSKGSMLISDFLVHLNDFKISVQRNSIKDCLIDGNLTITSLKDPTTNQAPQIAMVASVSDSGLASLQVQTGTIPLSAFNAQMKIENGTIQHDPTNNRTLLSLTGNWTFTDSAPDMVKGLAVQVNGLQIDNKGAFALDSIWIDMPESSNLDCDLVTLEARQIGFGGIGPGKTAWVGFNGKVGIGGDLPVQAEADFEGLFIYATGEVRVGEIGIDCDVKDIIHVTGHIEETDGTLTRSTYKDNMGVTQTNIGTDGNYLHTDSAYQVDPSKLQLDGPNGTKVPLKILSGSVQIQLPILGGGVDAADADSDSGSSGGPGGEVQFMVARNCWFVMGSFNSTTPLILLGDSGMALYGFGGAVGYNIKAEVTGATGVPAIDYQVIPDIDAIQGKTQTASGLPNVIAVAAVRVGSAVAPAPIWGDIVLVADIGNLTFTLEGNCYVGCEMPVLVPAAPSSMDRVLHASLSFNGVTKTFIIDGDADFAIPSKTADAAGNDTSLMRLYAPFHAKIGLADSTDAGFVADKNNRVFYARLGGPVDLGAESKDNTGISAHRNVSIANPVTLKIRNLQPLQGAVTLDMNAGKFMAALKLHESFHVDSGPNVQTYNVVVCDFRVATIKYKYSLDGELDTTGWLTVDFPGFVANPNAKPGLDSINASGEFYVYASLVGKATNLEVDPRSPFNSNFSVPDLSLSAVVEADISGSISPTSVSIEGQAYADVSFSVGSHSFSLPISKDVKFSSSL